jgi:site-specific DNA-methyltransferase (adenine-specific)
VRYVATETLPIDSLQPYPGNARIHDTEALDASAETNGQYRSVVARRVDGGVQILAGHGTWGAFQRRGDTSIRAEIIEADDTEARRIMLADNGTSRNASYDERLLLGLLNEASSDGGLVGTGWDGDAYKDLLNSAGSENPFDHQPAAEPAVDFDATPPPEPVTQLGDVWLLGRHRIICGDCRNPATLGRLLDGRAVDVAFTSPPYASQRTYDEASGFRPIHPDQYVDWFDAVQANVRGVLASHGSWFVNIKEHCDDGERHLYVYDLAIAHRRKWSWKFVDEMVWLDSSNGMPGSWPNRFKDAWERVYHFATASQIKFRPDAVSVPSDSVPEFSPERWGGLTAEGYVQRQEWDRKPGLARPSNVVRVKSGGDGSHSAAFPVGLPQWFIRAYTDPGDAVLDVFMGSGTTLIAAHREGRDGYGSEISPGYCDVIARRYQELTGEMPVLESTQEPVDMTKHAA